MATETWAQVRTYMDHSWDVPDDHFTDDVLCHWKCLITCLTEDERDFVRTRGSWKQSLEEEDYIIPSGGFGFKGWNPKCIPTIYYINWKIEQERMVRERGTTPQFVENKKTSSDLRREAGEKRRREGTKESYDRPKKKYVYK